MKEKGRKNERQIPKGKKVNGKNEWMNESKEEKEIEDVRMKTKWDKLEEWK